MDYRLTAAQLTALVEDVPYPIANLANASALLWENMENINWVGFYQYQDAQLVLGPFQGKPACVQIPMGKGVCGTAAATGQIQLVKDVHAFPGHSYCVILQGQRHHLSYGNQLLLGMNLRADPAQGCQRSRQ